jgi:hypothetical protein
MEQEGTVTNQPVGKKVLNIWVILLFAFILYYTVMSLLSPGKKMKELRNEFALNQDSKTKTDKKVLSDLLFLKMLREKACLQSRISMAGTDSIYLTINLSDSIANLEISGVVVHTARISGMKISRLLKKGDQYIISSLLSSALSIEKEISSIEKEPLMISIAPKDTSEFQPDVIPDTTDFEPVSYILETNNDIRLYFCQDEEESRFNSLEFDFRDRISNALKSLRSVALLKIPEYKPYIRIHLPRADAKIIYRALPKQGHIVVCM